MKRKPGCICASPPRWGGSISHRRLSAAVSIISSPLFLSPSLPYLQYERCGATVVGVIIFSQASINQELNHLAGLRCLMAFAICTWRTRARPPAHWLPHPAVVSMYVINKATGQTWECAFVSIKPYIFTHMCGKSAKALSRGTVVQAAVEIYQAKALRVMCVWQRTSTWHSSGPAAVNRWSSSR